MKSEKEQITKVKNKAKVSTLTLLIILSMLLVPMVYSAGTPEFSILRAQPTKAGYYLEETVNVAFKLKWLFLAQNYTIDVELWEGTTKLLTLDDDYLVEGQFNENSTYTATYADLAELTEELGTETYILKVIDTTSGLLLGSDTFNILVAEESLRLSVSWDDSNDDRVIDVAESIIFTAYTTWTFIEDSASHTLYVAIAGSDTLIGTVDVTAGSGSASTLWTTSFNSAGTKPLTFKLKDNSGDLVGSTTASVVVGATTTETTTTTTTATWVEVWNQYMYYIIGAVVLAIIALWYYTKE